jgi:hypothetical protein
MKIALLSSPFEPGGHFSKLLVTFQLLLIRYCSSQAAYSELMKNFLNLAIDARE